MQPPQGPYQPDYDAAPQPSYPQDAPPASFQWRQPPPMPGQPAMNPPSPPQAGQGAFPSAYGQMGGGAYEQAQPGEYGDGMGWQPYYGGGQQPYQAPLDQPPPLEQPAPQTIGQQQPPPPPYTPPPSARPGGTQQGNGYRPPNTGMPRARKPRSNRWIYWTLAVLVVLFAVAAVFRMMTPGQVAYGFVQAGSLNSRYTGDALVVRDETVYTHEGAADIEYIVAEGSRCTRSTPVAKVYTSGFNAKEWINLSNYRNQIKEYHKTLINSATGDSRLITLLSKVREQAMETQRLVQEMSGSLSGQADKLKDTMDDMREYIKQKYPDDQKLNRLYDDEKKQLQSIATWEKQYALTADGLVSFYVDGFETALNMETYAGYSPAQVREMYNGELPVTENAYARSNIVSVYRLVREQPWVVLMLCNEKEWTPVTGREYELRINSFDNTTVRAAVESFTRSGGELLVRLKINDVSALPGVLYNRSCQVQLGENVNTLMVPSRAVTVQDGHKGVVIALDGGEYWVRVEVISDDGQDACVVPENISMLYEGMRVRLF